MEEHEPREEHWTFGGSRVGGKGQTLHAWLAEPDGSAVDELWFKASGSFTVGSMYTMTVSRRLEDGKERVTRHGGGTYVQRNPNTSVREELEARHRAAETALKLAALERNDKRHSALDDALAPLERLMRQASSVDRDALLTYVMRKLSRAW